MDPNTRAWEKDAAAGYALLRITLGLDIFLHGAVRWAGGLGEFAGPLIAEFQSSPLPEWSVHSFGYALPILEAVIGAAILIGFQTRRALIAGGILMLVLIFGSSLRQDWQIVGLQLTYSLIYALLLATVRFNRYCLDGWLGKKS